jgi:hypothetical protein
MPVSRLERAGIAVFFADSPTPEVWTRAPLRDSATQFHRVLHELFSSVAIIPFRFPTIMGGEQEMLQHLDERTNQYKDSLQKFRSSVQMEALISYSSSAEPSPTRSSGAEYLRARQKRREALQHFVSRVQAAVSPAIIEWRHRALPDGIRFCALVERPLVPNFTARMRGVIVREGLTVRVTGPWPVTEFLDTNQG